MKNIAILLLITTLFSCNTESSRFPTTPTKWKITRIEPNDNNTSRYLLRPIDTKDLNSSSTWIIDSVGKFKSNDILSFQISK